MPRIKCYFCDDFITVKPQVLKVEGVYPMCMLCKEDGPTDMWRCNARVIKGKNDNGGKRIEGARCRHWISKIGERHCTYHKRKLEK